MHVNGKREPTINAVVGINGNFAALLASGTLVQLAQVVVANRIQSSSLGRCFKLLQEGLDHCIGVM